MSGAGDDRGQSIGVPGAPGVVVDVVVAVGAVDEACGVGGEKAAGAAVAVAVAVVDEAAGFFPFAVGSVAAGFGAGLLLEETIGGILAAPGDGAAVGNLGGEIAALVVKGEAGVAAAVFGVETATDSAADVIKEAAVVFDSVPFFGGAAAAEGEEVGRIGDCGLRIADCDAPGEGIVSVVAGGGAAEGEVC